MDLLLEGIRSRFLKLGVKTMQDIINIFHEMDSENKDGQLSLDEFVQGMSKIGMPGREAAFIFSAFDQDDSGLIDTEEFCYLVKGGLNDRRKAVVHEAFFSLDRTGDGVITIEDLEKAFDVAKAVEVMAGAKTKEEMMHDFLSGFDTITTDGSISLVEFETYYENVGALIVSDDYFEAMIRNAWHLEGADGGHCLRLQVTNFDGHGRVVEIRQDMEINRQSPRFFEKIKKLLEDRGHKDIMNIEILGRY
jgi:Ca2+-binding EF-hand superfamily protein